MISFNVSVKKFLVSLFLFIAAFALNKPANTHYKLRLFYSFLVNSTTLTVIRTTQCCMLGSGEKTWQGSGRKNNHGIFRVRKSRIPLIRFNWDSEPSKYAENPDNWIFI